MPQEPNLHGHHLPTQQELGNVLLSLHQFCHRANLAYLLGKALTFGKVVFERKSTAVKAGIGVGLVVLLIKYLLIMIE